MNLKNNIKGDTTFVFITIIVGIISFFIIFQYFISFGDNVVSSSNDLSCRAYISTKDKVPDLLKFMFDLNLKCKKDEINIKDNDKNKIFKKTAEELGRCWYRYGSGKEDFLNSYDTSGSWCFTCGVINFDDNYGDKYYLNDFIDWSDKNYVILGNKSKVPYSKTFNMKYSNVDEDKMSEISNNIRELGNEPGMDELKYLFTEQYEFLQDLRLKSINTNAKTYVVYRYDKTNISDKMTNAIHGAYWGIGTSIVGGLLAEQILWTVGTLAVCTVGEVASLGLLSPICAAMGVKTISSYGQKVGEVVSKTKNIANLVKDGKIMVLMEDLSTSVKTTLKAKFVSKISTMEGSVDDLLEVSLKLKNTNLQLSNKLLDIYSKLKSLGINNLDELKDLEKINEVVKLHETFDMLVDGGSLLENSEVLKYFKENKILSELNELKSNEKYLKNLKKTDSLSEVDKAKLKKYIKRVTFVTVSAATGAYIGSNFNFNSNQYVDILTEEQYFRLCGTEPPENYK